MLRLIRHIRRLRRDSRGVVAIIIALMMPVLIGFTALGVEATLWYMKAQNLQSAADMAAYSGGWVLFDGGTDSEAAAVARGEVDDNYSGSPTITISVPDPDVGGTSIEVVLADDQALLFASVFRDEPVTLRARATAEVGEEDTDACILSLNESDSGALTFTGNANVDMAGCDMVSNSSADDALSVGGSASVRAKCLKAVGGVDDSGGNLTMDCAQPVSGSRAMQDPYADVGLPGGSCMNGTSTNNNSTPSCTDTGSDPDVYTYDGGLKLQGNETLASGVHVVKGGNFQINANAVVNGTDVTIILTDGADIKVNGSSTVNLAAPTSDTNPYKGVLLYKDRDDSDTNDQQFINGNMSGDLDGALYFPSHFFRINGNASVGGKCVQFIADTMDFKGSGDTSNDCATSGVETIKTVSRVRLTR